MYIIIYYLGFSVDDVMILISIIGALSGFLVFVGLCNKLTLFICWITYLSIFLVGQEFLAFQWDILLLEVGFLSIIYAPSPVFGFSSSAAQESQVSFANKAVYFLRVFILQRLFSYIYILSTSGVE